MKAKLTALLFLIVLSLSATAWAEKVVDIHALTAEGDGDSIGTISLSETPYGTLFTPALTGLRAGMHGFHVHEGGSCAAAEKDGKLVLGLAAGGHYDPHHSKAHKGPFSDGHLGDLPPLYADPAGMATLPVLAPKIRLSDLKGHALIIHQGADNYSDTPRPLGGGGDRIACGVVE